MGTPLPHALPSVISSLNESSATLTLTDGQTLTWPRTLLPQDIHVGETIELVAFATTSSTEEHAHLARAMLNEFLRES